ncbi:hypothetical protein RGF97_06270 [Streptomyces roseicoloratus]|uniref:Uncharacterized protein n=1 Tax=Streptomyces roseicoloratus TaxID=2508722 RepID=A0ABY9S6Y8_9ACTN|nr:hypothetical protein [Streptomyces roseicoloratus]WMX49139.1 hypothetical protein RGF97_06270 [Streptomyces roseicoloratus]
MRPDPNGPGTSAKPSITNCCRRTSRAPAKLKRLVKLGILTEIDTGSFARKQ